METYSNAALSDEMQRLRKRQDKQSQREMMFKDAFNDVVEVVNSISELLDGYSTHKSKVSAADGQKVSVKLTFIGKKLDYLELTDGELGEAR